jgi:hypothetical protein
MVINEYQNRGFAVARSRPGFAVEKYRCQLKKEDFKNET